MSDDLSLDARLLRFRADPAAESCQELSAALLEAKRSREALEVLSHGLSLRADDARLLCLMARAFLAEGEVLRAQQTLTRVIRSHPTDVDAYRWLAETLLQRGDVGRAQAAVAKALKLAPDDAALQQLHRRLTDPAHSEPKSMEAPAASPRVMTALETRASAPVAPEVEAGLGEKEQLAEDVTRLLEHALKSASALPPATGSIESPAGDAQVPGSAPLVDAFPLPAPEGAGTALPVTREPGSSAAFVPPAGELPKASELSPASESVAPPSVRPPARVGPLLMGVAPPRPSTRPASIPAPPRSAPLPVIRPPSVRPAGLEGPVPPPDFSLPPLPLPPALAAPAPAAPARAPSEPPQRAVVLAPAAPTPWPDDDQDDGDDDDDDDEPTSFLDRSDFDRALRESEARPEGEPAASATESGRPWGGASTEHTGSLSDMIAEFAEPVITTPASVRPSPQVSESRTAPTDGEPLMVAPILDAMDDMDAAAPAASVARRPGRSGLRWWLALLVLLALFGVAFAAHRAGHLPKSWSAAIDQHWAALTRRVFPGAAPPQGTAPAAAASSSRGATPEADAAALRIAQLDGELAEGRIPSDLPDDAHPESLRVQTDAALLRATPWWNLSATPEDRASLDQVAAQLAEALAAQPSPATALRASAIRLAAARGEANALPTARALVREYPEDALSHWALAEALIAAGAVDEAAPLLAALVATGPESMRARAAVQVASLAAGRGDRAAARSALETARIHAPEWELVRLRLLDLRLDAGEYRAALAELGEPGDSEALILRALRAQLGLQELEASEALWARLSEDARLRRDVQPLAAQYYMVRGEPAEAVRVLAGLAQAQPGDPTLIALYGTALDEAGQTLEATAQFERAIALDEGHPEALMGFAQSLLRARRHNDARTHLDRAEVELRARSRPPAGLARLQVIRARILVEKREFASAIELLRGVLETEGAPSEGWFYLGEALARSNWPASRAAYERYLELHPVGPLASRARRAIQ